MMHLKELIDQMIDQAKEHDLLNTYVIVLGAHLQTDDGWVKGKRVYRWFPVAQSRLVPDDLVVLLPSPDNFRTGNLVEFHGYLSLGQIIRHDIRIHEDSGGPAMTQLTSPQ